MFPSYICLLSEFQVTQMNLWGISSSFRCGFLLNSQLHYKSIYIKAQVRRSSLPHSQTEHGVSKTACLLRYTRKAAKQTKRNMLLCSLIFLAIALLLNTRKKKNEAVFCFACVVLLSARDLISLLCVTVWSTGPGSNWPRVM